MPRRRRPRRPGALTELPPLKILGQIAALQGVYYAAALILTLFTALVAGTGFSLDLVFGWESVRGDTTQGWLMGFVWVLTGGFCLPAAIVSLVARSKLVPDFALSAHFIHFLICSFYTGFIPRHMMWWMSMAISSAMAVALGLWGCRYRELQPISFGGGGAARQEDQPASNPPAEDEEMGISRGRGRGRGRDGGGEYEMVRMSGEERLK